MVAKPTVRCHVGALTSDTGEDRRRVEALKDGYRNQLYVEGVAA